MITTRPVERVPRTGRTRFIPRALGDGLVEVDSTWGTVQPIVLAAGVETVGELEVIDHLSRGLPLVDCRRPHHFAQATIPTARNIPHIEMPERIAELDPSVPTVFFCNGPQCSATPAAVRLLLDSGYPAAAVRYYRGGMHDWMTLGFPTVRGAPADGWDR